MSLSPQFEMGCSGLLLECEECEFAVKNGESRNSQTTSPPDDE